MKNGQRFSHKFYRKVIKGQSPYRNARRYELVSSSLFMCSLVASLVSALFAAFDEHHQSDNTIPNIALFTLVLIILWWLSRTGRHTITAFTLLLCSSIALANIMLTRRFGMPSIEIGIALFVTIVGTLLEVRLTRAELAAERDLLEQRVIERTQMLEETQLRRTLELQRFAEFGRISAQLLHEVANPLTVASLYLQQVDERSSDAIRQARRSLQQLERYLAAARKQLRVESQPTTFHVATEIKQLIAILKPVAHKAGVRIVLDQPKQLTITGDPVHFSQIIANVIVNAIDVYEGVESAGPKIVTVRITQLTRYAQITVHDNGAGITPVQLTQIFEPFYTTKHSATRGLGIGLAIVKRSVKEHFSGTICANSTPEAGTTFTLLLRLEPALTSVETSQSEPQEATTLVTAS